MKLDIVCEDERYIPCYANPTDACMDLKIKCSSDIVLPTNQKVVVGTGVKVKIPEGYVMLIYPRSSTGFKLDCILSNTTGVIDSGYRDEIKLSIRNLGDTPVHLTDGQRLCQFIILPRPHIDLNIVEDDDYFRTGDRGGGIGSTGVN